MEKDMVGVKWHQRDGARWETVPARDGVDEGRQETVVVRWHKATVGGEAAGGVP